MRIISLRLRIPAVSAYVVGGVILGGSLFFWHPGGKSFSEQWLFTRDVLSEMVVITQIALGIIALTIGAEIEWRNIRKLGKSILFITFFGALVPMLFVTVAVTLIWHDFPLGLLLGAVASATAPAATVAVIHQYKSKGPLTNTIFAVVGLDDAFSFIAFAFSLALIKAVLAHESISMLHGIFMPLMEIIISFVVGIAFGTITSRLLYAIDDNESSVFIFAALILTISGLAAAFNFSSLLSNMAAGTTIVNLHPSLKSRLRLSFRAFTPIFFTLFFILGGAHLDLSGIAVIWKISLVFFLCRALGKISGASFGAIVGNALPAVKRWVGISMLPQVGAAVALALVVEHEFGGGAYGNEGIVLSNTIFNILLVTTFFTEFIGPYLTKISLVHAGEVEEKP